MEANPSSRAEGAWYVRKEYAVRGLFPAHAIVRDVALGRLGAGSEVSRDGMRWISLQAPDGPLPGAIRAGASLRETDDWAMERHRALLRWVDERSGQDRRTAAPGNGAGERRCQIERRQAVDVIGRPARAAQHAQVRQRNDRLGVTLVGLVALIAVAGLLGLGGINPIPVRIHPHGIVQQPD